MIDDALGFPHDLKAQAALSRVINEVRMLVVCANVIPFGGRTVDGYLTFGAWREHLPFLHVVRVHPDAQRQRIAQGLVQAACRLLAERYPDASAVVSACDITNAPGLALHRKLTFVPCGQVDLARHGAREMLWRLPLPGRPG